MQNDHTERKHALFGGSSADRWLRCLASVKLSADMPPEPETEWAAEGTKAHELCEQKLKAFVVHRRTGKEHKVIEWDDSFMNTIADQYVEHIWNEVLDGSVTDKVILFEEKLILRPDVAFGFVDLAVLYIDDRGRRAAWVADFKYGYVQVDAEDNMQLAFYACALQRMLKAKGKEVEYVNVGIYQPRAEGETWKTWSITAKQMEKLTAKFDKALDDYQAGKIKAKLGEHCFYCKAKAICRKYKEDLMSRSSLTNIDGTQPSLPAIGTLTTEQRVKLYLVKDEVEKFFGAIAESLYNDAAIGRVPDGLKIVESKTRRKWANDTDKIAILELGKLAGKEITQTKLMPLTQVEKMIPKADRAELDKYITRTDPKPVLVAQEDVRQSLQPKGVALLSELDE